MPTRCLRCRGFQHHAKSCKRPSPASPDLVVDGCFSQRVAAPRCQKTSFAQHRRTTSSPAEAAGLPHGPSPAVAAHAGGKRWRRRSRHRRRERDNISDAPAGSSGDAAAARAAHGEMVLGPRLLVPDPLVLTLWPHDTPTGRNTTDDPMLEEFAASSLSLGAAPAIARLKDVPPAEVSYTCSLPGRYQAPPQHADLVLQTPPPCPTLQVAGLLPVSSQQEHT